MSDEYPVDLSASLARTARAAAGSAVRLLPPAIQVPPSVQPEDLTPMSDPQPFPALLDGADDAAGLEGAAAPSWEPETERDYLAEAVAAARPDPDYVAPAAAVEDLPTVPDMAGLDDFSGSLPARDPLPGASTEAFAAFSDLNGVTAMPEPDPAEPEPEADPEAVAALLAGFDPSRYLSSSPAPAGPAHSAPAEIPVAPQMGVADPLGVPGDALELDAEAHSGPRTPEDVLSMLRELNSLKDQR